MAQHWSGKGFALLTLVAFVTGSSVAQGSGGILYPNDGVTLNGRFVFVSAAVTQGNKVQTSVKSTLLAIPGAMLQLFPNTTLSFDRVVQLGCGGLVVMSVRGVAVQAAGMTVAAADGNTQFEILNGSGRIDVIVRNGSVQISDATAVLQAGQSATRVGDAGCPAVRPIGATAPATATAAKHTMRTVLIVGAAGGGGAAAAVLATRKSVSPSQP